MLLVLQFTSLNASLEPCEVLLVWAQLPYKKKYSLRENTAL